MPSLPSSISFVTAAFVLTWSTPDISRLTLLLPLLSKLISFVSAFFLPDAAVLSD